MCAAGLICSTGAFAEGDYSSRTETTTTTSDTSSGDSDRKTGSVSNDRETRAGQNTKGSDTSDMDSRPTSPPNATTDR
jgi:hypothetical protein